MMKCRNSKKNTNYGFTLVELIVVLVILAILAAVLIPALLGYIDKARQKKDILRAKACLDATQAALVEEYAKGTGPENGNVAGIELAKVKVTKNGDKYKGYGDVNCVGSDFAKKILSTVDEDPYIFFIATGNCNAPGVSKHDMYTVCYACYVPEEGARPYYYYNGAWTTENGANVNSVVKNESIQSNTLGSLPIQYYIIANKYDKKAATDKTASDNFWNYLRQTLPEKYGDTPKTKKK